MTGFEELRAGCLWGWTSVLLSLAFLLVSAPVTHAKDEPFLHGFVAGDYVLIGKEPDNGKPYTGLARIEPKGSGLLLHRTLDGKTVTAEGKVEVPHPPGEGQVLRFRWQEGGEVVLSCLVASDLDNYARLTCYRILEGVRHKEPGLEALFPIAAWPDDAPSKMSPPARNP
jgi:hypothetical protein